MSNIVIRSSIGTYDVFYTEVDKVTLNTEGESLISSLVLSTESGITNLLNSIKSSSVIVSRKEGDYNITKALNICSQAYDSLADRYLPTNSSLLADYKSFKSYISPTETEIAINNRANVIIYDLEEIYDSGNGLSEIFLTFNEKLSSFGSFLIIVKGYQNAEVDGIRVYSEFDSILNNTWEVTELNYCSLVYNEIQNINKLEGLVGNLIIKPLVDTTQANLLSVTCVNNSDEITWIFDKTIYVNDLLSFSLSLSGGAISINSIISGNGSNTLITKASRLVVNTETGTGNIVSGEGVVDYDGNYFNNTVNVNIDFGTVAGFSETFDGTVVDSSKWTIDNPNNLFTQDEELRINNSLAGTINWGVNKLIRNKIVGEEISSGTAQLDFDLDIFKSTPETQGNNFVVGLVGDDGIGNEPSVFFFIDKGQFTLVSPILSNGDFNDHGSLGSNINNPVVPNVNLTDSLRIRYNTSSSLVEFYADSGSGYTLVDSFTKNLGSTVYAYITTQITTSITSTDPYGIVDNMVLTQI